MAVAVGMPGAIEITSREVSRNTRTSGVTEPTTNFEIKSELIRNMKALHLIKRKING
jgi:hypothetical protein